MTKQELLLKYWGYSTFRPIQEEVIDSVLNNNDTIALLPTGGGKSICFQIPGLIKDGVTIVISPLISLMKDQVEKLTEKGIKAIAINSIMNKREVDIALDNCIYGKVKFLYLSPEGLNSELVKERIKRMKVSFVAVDEAHCISQWGYDFRPAYLNIKTIRELKPNIPILALTATANKKTLNDIAEKLDLNKPSLYKKSFERKNLAFAVLKEEDKHKKLLEIVKKVKGSGIVYVRNRKKTKEIASFLNKNKISATFYHAGIEAIKRNKIQEDWINNKTRIIISTNAFGMGIDKPDVRFVIHIDIPSSIEEYIQECGRAGRDEKIAFAIMLWNEKDYIELTETVETKFPEVAEIKKVYTALCNYFKITNNSAENIAFDFDITDFCKVYSLNIKTTYSCISLIEKEGYIQLTDAFYQTSKLNIIANKEDLYTFQVQNQLHDKTIRLILRSYANVFSDYVKIKESEIAKRLNKTKGDIIKDLEYFNKLKLVSYIKESQAVKIVFLKPRVQTDTFFINHFYRELKKRYEEHVQTILSYVKNQHKCRSEFILSYFGEKNTKRCGNCDVCKKINDLELTDFEYSAISNKIMLIIKRKVRINIDLLVLEAGEFKKEKVIKVARYLIDSDEIKLDPKNSEIYTE